MKLHEIEELKVQIMTFDRLHDAKIVSDYEYYHGLVNVCHGLGALTLSEKIDLLARVKVMFPEKERP